ncbi:hypothetical protein SDC9_143941 [bioreactor metagenome]|uniref:Uncharacterized protein n=1 Tax=bioreactor metagenome TaxID=1076179 RepID=A0A645E5J0_9ZZZZ
MARRGKRPREEGIALRDGCPDLRGDTNGRHAQCPRLGNGREREETDRRDRADRPREGRRRAGSADEPDGDRVVRQHKAGMDQPDDERGRKPLHGPRVHRDLGKRRGHPGRRERRHIGRGSQRNELRQASRFLRRALLLDQGRRYLRERLAVERRGGCIWGLRAGITPGHGGLDVREQRIPPGDSGGP